MGTFRSTYVSPNSTKLSDQAQRPAATERRPAPKLEVAAMPVEPASALPKREVAVLPSEEARPRASVQAAAVSNAQPDVKPVSNGAVRIARWRAKQDPEVRKQRNREAVQRSRAKAKAGKVAS